MSYIGSTPTTQSFIAGTDYFNGTGSAVSFTLSRAVNSVNDIEVIVNNVEQIPSGYSVSGTTLTFSAAPSAGTSNVYVRYLSTTNLSLAIPAGTSATFNTVTVADGSATTPSITNDGDTNTGIFFPAADTIAFAEGGAEAMRIDSSGQVGIGTTSPTRTLDVSAASATVFLTSSTGTNRVYYGTSNTGGGTYFGRENSAGTSFGSSAYASVVWSEGAYPLVFATNNTERARIDSSGNVGIGTASPASRLHVSDAVAGGQVLVTTNETNSTSKIGSLATMHYTNAEEPVLAISVEGGASENTVQIGGGPGEFNASTSIRFFTAANSTTTGGTERARIASDGAFLIGKTTTDDTTQGFAYRHTGYVSIVRNGGAPLTIHRRTDDGELVEFFQENVKEGNISVSGTTVSYNGGHLSRWAQTTAPKDDTLVKGTVLSNLDEMNVYTKDGHPVENEQLNKVKVSDVEGDANVAGVFVNWDHDEAHNVDEINMAMTGDMIIRVAQGTTVARGDLLMSAGDGTAKPQGDDIVRSKTVAKVTSTHVTCTYADGSFCVPCVLMAC